MKAKPYKMEGSDRVECAPQEATHVMLHMLGPWPNRLLPVIQHGNRRDHERPVWTWNGDTEKPTLRPSILTGTPGTPVCHTWITDGRAIYLPDCSHEYAGQTHDLLEVE